MLGKQVGELTIGLIHVVYYYRFNGFAVVINR
jgi:hypothetical protein